MRSNKNIWRTRWNLDVHNTLTTHNLWIRGFHHKVMDYCVHFIRRPPLICGHGLRSAAGTWCSNSIPFISGAVKICRTWNVLDGTLSAICRLTSWTDRISDIKESCRGRTWASVRWAHVQGPLLQCTLCGLYVQTGKQLGPVTGRGCIFGICSSLSIRWGTKSWAP